MGRRITRRWPSLLVLALLLSTLVPSVALAQPEPEAPDPTSGANCTGDPAANYNGTCGPSLTIPAWSDASGWWNYQSTKDTIQLFDLDGDGSDELIGLGQHGLQVYSWHSAWGQWMPASDPKQAGPFAGIDVYYDSIRFGMLADGVAGVIGVHFNPDGGNGVAAGLQTWTWNPGDGSPGAGSWTFQGEDTAFATDSTAPANPGQTPYGMSYPSWRVPIQFVPGGLSGAGHGILLRVYTGMQFCAFDISGQTWTCKQVTSAFQDDPLNDGLDLMPDYYYGTIQLADVYTGAEGLELIGRDGTNGGSMQVYTWDSGSQTFNHLALSGQTPFDSSWNATQYTATIRAARYVANDPAYELVGHGPDQLVYWAIWASGCGGQTAPCWKKYGGPNIQSTPFTSPAYSDPQFYETFIVTDLDGDGLDETMARDPQVGFTTWGLHQTWGWYNLYEGPVIISFPGYALWATPAYYETIKVADAGAGQKLLIARGKYGIRTWSWQGKDGWQRPLPYGFGNFATNAEDNAFALLNAYLDIADGNTVRDSYTSPNTGVMNNYVDCLNASVGSGVTMPPVKVCSDFGTDLANPDGVTAADWQNMVAIIGQEIKAARAVDSHFNTTLSGILSELYELDQSTFDQIIQHLFPSNPPSSGSNVTAVLQNLFWGFAEALANFGAPEITFTVDALSATVGAVESLQSTSGSTVEVEVSQVQTQMAETAGAAVQRNTDFFQYVAQDGGLLNLYGSLINDQVWEIQGAQRNAAISTGQYTNAKWLYQSLLPLIWQVWACLDDVSVGASPCSISGLQEGVNGIWLGGSWKALIGEIGTDKAIDPSDPTFQKVFGSIASNCTVGGTTNGENWIYQGCNLGAQIDTVLYFGDGWTQFTCTVDADDQTYACGQGPPEGYGPPS